MVSPTPEPPSFEAAVGELETIVQQMENGQLPLEEALDRYQRGTALLRHCQALLDRAEQTIRVIESAEAPPAAPAGGEPA